MGEAAQWVKSLATETGGAGYESPSPSTPMKARHSTSVCHAGAFIGRRETRQQQKRDKETLSQSSKVEDRH